MLNLEIPAGRDRDRDVEHRRDARRARGGREERRGSRPRRQLAHRARQARRRARGRRRGEVATAASSSRSAAARTFASAGRTFACASPARRAQTSTSAPSPPTCGRAGSTAASRSRRRPAICSSTKRAERFASRRRAATSISTRRRRRSTFRACPATSTWARSAATCAHSSSRATSTCATPGRRSAPTRSPGDQNFEAVLQGRIELKAISGDVTVGIRSGARVFVDANTVSGVDELGARASETRLPQAPAPDSPLVEVFREDRVGRRAHRASARTGGGHRAVVTLWPEGGLWRHSGFSQALVGGDRQSVRDAVQRSSRCRSPRSIVLHAIAVRGRGADRRSNFSRSCSSACRPASGSTVCRGVRSWSLGDLARAGLLASRSRSRTLRRADDLAALSRVGLPRRDRDRLLRRRVPVVSARARRPAPAHRRELEAGDQPFRARSSAGRVSPVSSSAC